MKRLVFIVSLLAATYAIAQEHAPQAGEPCQGWLPNHPAHYCECHAASQVFQFPLTQDISDTTWFVASVDDLRLGLTAYWLSNCSVTFEVYAFCSSKTPTVKMTVGANLMYEMDATAINQKIEEMGDLAEMMMQALEPRVKVYPNGGTGRVYCYPYNQGPVSTCDKPLEVLPRMTYVCDQAEEVYEIKPNNIATNGNGFIRWKQKKNLESTVWLTRDSCNGPEIARAVLSDSMRVLILNADTMKAVKAAGSSAFVHVTHPADYVGRMIYRNTVKWDALHIDTTFCQGKRLVLPDTALTESTFYTNDTLLKGGDTLSLATYNVHVIPPEPQYDTLRLKASGLPRTYKNQYIPKGAWGDHNLTIHQENQCDEQIYLHIEHLINTTETTTDMTLCMGKTYTYNSKTYSADTALVDSIWKNDDTKEINHITLQFTEPVMEYDTISILPSQIKGNGFYYKTLGVYVKQFGDTVIVKTKKNDCTRRISLTVLEQEDLTPTNIENTEYQPNTRKIMRDGVLYIRRDEQEYDVFGRPVNNKK